MTSSAALSEENIDQMLKGIIIPSPPQVIADLQMEMAMPDPDMSTIAGLINRDAALAGSILKVANSPFYGLREIGSIQQAVMMLGMNTVVNIVNTVQLREMSAFADDMTEEMQLNLSKFWDSAEDVAKGCSLIAHRLSFIDVDKAYMLGLFHNAGIPLLMHKHPNYLVAVAHSYQSERERIIDIENEEFKTNHAVVGYYVARSWKLPEMIGRVIAEHHNGPAIFRDEGNTDVEKVSYHAVLKMAEHMATLYSVLGSTSVDYEWEAIQEEVLDCLGLSEPDYDDIVSVAREQCIGDAYLV